MTCLRCNIEMKPVGHANDYRIGYETKEGIRATNTLPYVCPKCGIVELYVLDKEFLDNLKDSITKEVW